MNQDNTLEKGMITTIFNEPVYLINQIELASSPEIKSPGINAPEKAPISAPTEKVVASTAPVKVPVSDAPVNQKKKEIAIILEEGIKSTDPNFLSKILKALKLDINEITIKHTGEIENPAAFIDIHKPEKVLLFTNQALGFSTYQIVKMDDTIVLAADNLKILESNVEKKKALWGLLQQMFLK